MSDDGNKWRFSKDAWNSAVANRWYMKCPDGTWYRLEFHAPSTECGSQATATRSDGTVLLIRRTYEGAIRLLRNPGAALDRINNRRTVLQKSKPRTKKG